jgi:hypothetical protein
MVVSSTLPSSSLREFETAGVFGLIVTRCARWERDMVVRCKGIDEGCRERTALMVLAQCNAAAMARQVSRASGKSVERAERACLPSYGKFKNLARKKERKRVGGRCWGEETRLFYSRSVPLPLFLYVNPWGLC